MLICTHTSFDEAKSLFFQCIILGSSCCQIFHDQNIGDKVYHILFTTSIGHVSMVANIFCYWTHDSTCKRQDIVLGFTQNLKTSFVVQWMDTCCTVDGYLLYSALYIKKKGKAVSINYEELLQTITIIWQTLAFGIKH